MIIRILIIKAAAVLKGILWKKMVISFPGD